MSSSDAAALFDGQRLTMARQLGGLRKAELAKLVHKSPTAVAAWEAGSKRPTAATVAELSLALGVDPGFFAVRGFDTAAPPGVPHFRSLRSTSQLCRDQAFAYGRLALDVMDCIERHVEFPRVDVPTVPVETEEQVKGPEQAADLVRAEWELGEGPVRHVLRAIEQRGVLTVFSPADAATVDAYSFSSALRPVIVLNPLKHDYYRQRFDLAHELGHLVMHGDAEPGGRMVEEQANRFAAQFLMPANSIHASLPSTMGGNAWALLARLKEQWGVSIQALLFRARQLGTLSDVSYRNAMTSVSARGWRRSEPGQMTTLEQPSMLPRALQLLESEGVSIETLTSQSRVPAMLFNTITARAPQVPTRPVEGTVGPSSTRVRPLLSLVEELTDDAP